jgi:CheY-like chemotaxis protein
MCHFLVIKKIFFYYTISWSSQNAFNKKLCIDIGRDLSVDYAICHALTEKLLPSAVEHRYRYMGNNMPTLLVVEDDEANLSMLTRRLAWEGFDLLTATDGLSAIDQAQTHLPDLILLDLGLPGLNGWQVTQHLKSQSSTNWIPIIAITAYSLEHDIQRSLALGCSDYEIKPVNFESLLHKIQFQLNQVYNHEVGGKRSRRLW